MNVIPKNIKIVDNIWKITWNTAGKKPQISTNLKIALHIWKISRKFDGTMRKLKKFHEIWHFFLVRMLKKKEYRKKRRKRKREEEKGWSKRGEKIWKKKRNKSEREGKDPDNKNPKKGIRIRYGSTKNGHFHVWKFYIKLCLCKYYSPLSLPDADYTIIGRKDFSKKIPKFFVFFHGRGKVILVCNNTIDLKKGKNKR